MLCPKRQSGRSAGSLRRARRRAAWTRQTGFPIRRIFCGTAALYVDMAGAEDEVGYVVEGEGDWGEPVGFAVKGDRVTYVGPDYLEAMENPY